MTADVFHSIEPKEILKFRQKRKDERNRFIEALEKFQSQIQKADSPEVIDTIVFSEKKELDNALSEYKKSMDLLGALRFGGYLTSAICVGTSVCEAITGNIPVISTALSGAGVVVDILTGIAEKKVNNKNPYSYLAHVKSSFSRACNSGLPPYDVIGEYNYKLARGIEEFICD